MTQLINDPQLYKQLQLYPPSHNNIQLNHHMLPAPKTIRITSTTLSNVYQPPQLKQQHYTIFFSFEYHLVRNSHILIKTELTALYYKYKTSKHSTILNIKAQFSIINLNMQEQTVYGCINWTPISDKSISPQSQPQWTTSIPNQLTDRQMIDLRRHYRRFKNVITDQVTQQQLLLQVQLDSCRFIMRRDPIRKYSCYNEHEFGRSVLKGVRIYDVDANNKLIKQEYVIYRMVWMQQRLERVMVMRKRRNEKVVIQNGEGYEGLDQDVKVSLCQLIHSMSNNK